MSMNDKMKHTNEDIIFLKEANYKKNMIDQVRPILEHKRQTGYMDSFDQSKIYYEYYDTPNEKGTIVISHGFCEFSKKFEEVIYYFLLGGYSVYILDHRGHGYSQRMVEDKDMVYIRSYDDYVMDFHHFVTKVVLRSEANRKLILYAHSMGGAIGALYVEQYPDVFSCAILSSPMFDMSFGKFPTSFIWLIIKLYQGITSEKSYIIGHGPFNKVPIYEKSSCLSKERYHYIFSKRIDDENYRTYGASCAWTIASLRAVRKLHKDAHRYTIPTLLFQAGRDTSVSSRGHSRFVKRASNTKILMIPDSKHEIYNANTEIVEDYFRQIFTFLDRSLV